MEMISYSLWVAVFVLSILLVVGGLASNRRKIRLETEKTALQTELDTVQNRLRETELELVTAGVRSEEQLKFYQELNQEIGRSREQLQKDFEVLSNRVFEESRKKFDQDSKRTLDSSLEPLKQEIESFRKRVNETHQEDLKDRNRLQGQIIELQKQARQIGQDAVQLATALKGESKSQGNWGEMVLERLLEESGLEKGREYETQASYRDEDGRLKQPDVVIHLPENKDIVVDAKVSLKAWEAFFNADAQEQQTQALKDHLASIKSHIANLSGKSYQNLDSVHSLEFVFMFIPVEPAWMLALQTEPGLFQQAWNKGIVIVSTTTLMPTLRTVANIWRNEKQNRNAQEIANSAGGLYDQFALLIESLDKLGKNIHSVQESYDEARNRLHTGARGSIVKRIDNLKKLGARSRKQLPESARRLTEE